MNRTYKVTGRSKIRRSAFNLTYRNILTADMGIIYPVQVDEVVPGDIFHMGVSAQIRAMPLMSPLLHPINVTFHTFFWPYRFLKNAADDFNWEDFISGGEDGTDAQTLPTWEPTSYAIGSLWDYMGFPAGVDPDGAYPMDGPRQAYNEIYNEFYRDETQITEVAYDNESLLLRAWAPDRFTKALPWQQRGTSPALPLTGVVNIDASSAVGGTATTEGVFIDTAGDRLSGGAGGGTRNVDLTNALEKQTIDLSDPAVGTFDIADLRLAFQIQKFLERNARGGVRYTEFLRNHHDVSPRDDRLDRPEYIGGTKSPVMISDIPQTSESGTTEQGNLAGKGTATPQGEIGKYHVVEYGLIMTLMTIMPEPVYYQGIQKQWLKDDKYDFFFPEFINLSEQPIIRAELYANGTPADNTTVFGYQGMYDELRSKQNRISGYMRSTFAYWHLARKFTAYPELNQTFIECVPYVDEAWAVPAEPQFVANITNIIKAIRPIPIISEPGYLDH